MTGLFRLHIAVLVFLASFPHLAFANQQCSELFTAISQTQQSHQNFTREIEEFSDQHWSVTANSLPRIEVIGWYKRRLQDFVNGAKSLNDLERIFLTIEKTGYVDEQYQDAWRQIDFLSPLRSKTPQDFSAESLAKLNETLDGFLLESALPWTPTLEAFSIWESPDYARLVIEGWVENKPFLIDDYLNTGEQINMTLVRSLESVPQATKQELLKLIHDSLTVIDIWIQVEKIEHNLQKVIKAPSREWQFVQQLLLRSEILKALDPLPYKVNPRDLRPLESIFQKLHRHKQPYSFDLVFSVAKALQLHLRPLLGKTEFVDIFGSFPNLAAKIGVSDIDILFSPRVDQIYYDLVSQTSAGQPVPQALFQGQDALLFANSVTAAENAVRDILKTQQGLGDIFSVNLMNREEINGKVTIPHTIAQTETWFGMGSPLMVRISSDRIVLRYWDGLTGTREIPATLREFVLQ
jgi:hypothetical protein